MTRLQTFVVWGLPLLLAAWIAAAWRTPAPAKYHIEDFGRLPVMHLGRVKPLDSVARQALLGIRGKQTVRFNGRSLSATEWLLDLVARRERADEYNVFQVNDPQLMGLLGLNPGLGKYVSLNEILPHLDKVQQEANRAMQAPAQQRDLYDRAVVQLFSSLTTVAKLRSSLAPFGADAAAQALMDYETLLAPGMAAVKAKEAGEPHDEAALSELINTVHFWSGVNDESWFSPLPPLTSEATPENWHTFAHGMLLRLHEDAFHPLMPLLADMLDAYAGEDAERFNGAVTAALKMHRELIPAIARKASFESRFNAAEPFYHAMILYVLVFLLACVSWLVWPQALNAAAMHLLLIAFIVHTAGMFLRMWLQGRPPVTNLYSSAIYIGWMATLLGLILERVYRMGIGNLVAGMVGFATLIIAHHLAVQGDTLEVMRAVLDSNFWLATHVVCITTGYASTYLSGAIGIYFILRGALTRGLDAAAAAQLSRMTYGIVCFSMLFSFVGTVLGGIWADQSWGRFWGWDPKENGALLIVLWCAIILHARLAGLIRQRGLMVMVVLGNIITSFSWFGVNMLGIGLHSYGFMDQAFYWLRAFCGSQLLIAGLGMMNPSLWRSRWTSVLTPPGTPG